MSISFFVLWLNNGQEVRIPPHEAPKVKQALIEHLDTGKDSVVVVDSLNGDPFFIRASWIIGGHFTTSEGRLNTLQFVKEMEAEHKRVTAELEVDDSGKDEEDVPGWLKELQG